MLTKEKRGMVQKASQACFASCLQRAWSSWQATVHQHKLLRKALETRQVSIPFILYFHIVILITCFDYSIFQK